MNVARTCRTLALALCLLGGAFATGAGAQPLADPLATPSHWHYPDPQTTATFGTPTNPALPADFFGPGSDPFEGQVTFEGVPLDESGFGNASTLMLRGDHPVLPADPIGTQGTVDVEIVELTLYSWYDPIVVTYDGGASQKAWWVELRLSAIPPPPGSLTATKTHANGGTFDATLPVQPRFVFEQTEDHTVVILDTGLEGLTPLDLAIIEAPWVHAVDPALGVVAPSDGVFVPGVREWAPGDSGSQCPEIMLAVEQFDSLVHTMIPATWFPEPDPFVSQPGDGIQGTQIVFGQDVPPPLPADFFGPGSDPFEGTVALVGEPLGATEWGDYEVADTLLKRSGDPFDRCALPSPDSRLVYLEIVALNLRSVEPITVTYFGGMFPEAWDVHVGLSTAPVPVWGEMEAFKTHENGGTLRGYFELQPFYTFTRVGDGFQVILDTGLEQPPLFMEFTDGHWVHTVDPALEILAPSNGRFVPGVHEEIPGDPISQLPVALVAQYFDLDSRLVLWPAPAPMVAVNDLPALDHRVRAVPNPFNPATEIRFELERGGPVRLRIFDVQGKLVQTLIDGDLPRGAHSTTWRGTDDRGRRVPSGVYFGTLEADGAVRTTKIAVVK
ncbi:T9SS type A sorting domain-containing protein [bacterium]|nr:T9SS type A sorting domain-containing protein [bacterium]MBU1073241.1 T9SS type A sorting domain-containing protein [bacterium]MBU1674835.1 T9SS type A sorting domain-containing protein [bacterium]